MNTMKSTMAKIAEVNKVELASERVELGLIDDINKSISDLNVLFKDASKTETELDSLIKVLFPLLNKADALAIKIKDSQTKAINVQKKYVAALADLGLKPSESKENIALFDILDSIETRRERITDMLSNFK